MYIVLFKLEKKTKKNNYKPETMLNPLTYLWRRFITKQANKQRPWSSAVSEIIENLTKCKSMKQDQISL